MNCIKITKDTITIIVSVLSFLIAILSLFISYRSFTRDDHKLMFEAYYVFEDYKERKNDDYENICLIIRNVGRRVAIIKKVGLYIGKNNYDKNRDKIPKLLPGYYTSRDFLEIIITNPIEINENEEFILYFDSDKIIFESITEYLRKNNLKGIIAVLDSRGKTHYVPISPSMKFGYSM